VEQVFWNSLADEIRRCACFFYDSETYKLISNGVADMHCLSDEYLADELLMEWKEIHSIK
jgi:hypothetical protein